VPFEPDKAPVVIDMLGEPSPPPPRQRNGWTEALFAAVLVGVSFLLVGTALTTARFTGPDYAKADRTGTATVERCTERGPITLHGFGYYRRCAVTVAWNLRGPDRVTIDQPRFFDADPGDRIGDSFAMGRNGGTYSRPEVPHRRWVTVLGWGIGLLGLLPLLALAIYLRQLPRAASRS
jgi:hypothetical protein